MKIPHQLESVCTQFLAKAKFKKDYSVNRVKVPAFTKMHESNRQLRFVGM